MPEPFRLPPPKNGPPAKPAPPKASAPAPAPQNNGPPAKPEPPKASAPAPAPQNNSPPAKQAPPKASAPAPAPQNNSPPAKPAPQKVPAPAPAPSNKNETTPKATPPKKPTVIIRKTPLSKKAKAGIIAVTVIGLLIGIGVALFFVLRESKTSISSSTIGQNPLNPFDPNFNPSTPSTSSTATIPCSSAVNWGSEEATCDAPCGGIPGKKIIMNTNQHPCPGTPAWKVEDCVSTERCAGHTAAYDCIPGIPSDEDWSPCPSCRPHDMAADEELLQYQIVAPIRDALPGGRPCALEDILYIRPCQSSSRTYDPPDCPENKDCILSDDPIAIGPCSDPCGGYQTHVYNVEQAQSGNGLPCPWETIVRRTPCGSPDSPDCQAIIDCTADELWKDAGEWTQCTVPCGKGKQFQTREPVSSTDECPLTRERECTGPLGETCTSSAGEDCTPPTWDDIYTLCYMDCLGVSTSEQEKVLGTVPGRCPIGNELLDQFCPDWRQGKCPEPRDCQLSAWSTWSDCSQPCDHNQPEGGVQYRSREILQSALSGGKSCDNEVLLDVRPCNNIVAVPYTSRLTGTPETAEPTCNPQDCQVGPWEDITACSKPCGGGVKQQSRDITQNPQDGGTPCTGPFTRQVDCNTGDCGQCELETWEEYYQRHRTTREAGGWTPCEDGIQTRGPRALKNGGNIAGCAFSDHDDEQPFQVRKCGGHQCPLGPNEAYSSAFSQSSLLVCSGNGRCQEDGTCACDSGFQGPSCATKCPLDKHGNICSNHGYCDEDTGTCRCYANFVGETCETSVADHVQYTGTQVANPRKPCTFTMPLTCPLTMTIGDAEAPAFEFDLGWFPSGIKAPFNFLPLPSTCADLDRSQALDYEPATTIAVKGVTNPAAPRIHEVPRPVQYSTIPSASNIDISIGNLIHDMPQTGKHGKFVETLNSTAIDPNDCEFGSLPSTGFVLEPGYFMNGLKTAMNVLGYSESDFIVGLGEELPATYPVSDTLEVPVWDASHRDTWHQHPIQVPDTNEPSGLSGIEVLLPTQCDSNEVMVHGFCQPKPTTS